MSKQHVCQVLICQRYRLIVATALGVVAAPPHAADAATVNFYDVQIGATHITDTSPSPLSKSGSGSTPDFSYSYSVLAGPGLLGDSNSVTVGPGQSGGISSNTNFTMSGVILTGPVGSTLVQYNVNFEVQGSFMLSATDSVLGDGDWARRA